MVTHSTLLCYAATEQFVDDIVARMMRFTPEVTQLLDSLEDKVYFTRRRVRTRHASLSLLSSTYALFAKDATIRVRGQIRLGLQLG